MPGHMNNAYTPDLRHAKNQVKGLFAYLYIVTRSIAMFIF